MRLQDTILAAALALCAPWVQSQTVYRCGNSYSQQPCPGGAPVTAADPRTPAEAARSGSVAAADARRADAMEKARLAQEKNAPKAVVIAPTAPVSPPAAPAREGARAKPGKLDQFTAQSPRQPGEAKKKDGKDKAAKKAKDRPDA